MVDYNKLQPGLYLQVGGRMTALKTYGGGVGTFDDMLMRGSERNPSLETLAAEVGWVFVALSKRRQQILEIPYAWEQGGNELDGETPWDMPWMELCQQIDQSLQLYGQALLFKQRQRGAPWGIRWVDPVTTRPDYESATAKDGILWYIYTSQAGQQTKIPASEIIRFIRPGLRLLQPDASAGHATTLAASILRGIDQSSDVFYENNGLPVMLVEVPPGTGTAETSRVENAFRRLFNMRRGTQDVRTIGVQSGTSATPLSFKPTDLAMTELEDQKVNLILAAHDVPKSIALADAANYATAIEAKRSFVSSIGARLSYMAEVFNRDPDFKAAGIKLIVRTQDHFAMKEDESQRAAAFRAYLDGFEPEAAAYLVGISVDDFPSDIKEIFKVKQAVPAALQQAQQPPGQQPPPQQPDQESEAAIAEEKAYRRWLKKRDDPNPADFVAEHLADEEKELILWQVKGARESDNLTATLADAMRRLNEVMGEPEGADNDDAGE